MHTYTTLMTTMLKAAWQDIMGKSVKPILFAIPNEQLVDYNKKTTFIEIIIINKHQCKCIQHCHDNNASSHKAEHAGKISQANWVCHLQGTPCRLQQEDSLYWTSSKQATYLTIVPARICFSDWRSGINHLSKGPTSWKRDNNQKMIFCKTDGFTTLQIPQKTDINQP